MSYTRHKHVTLSKTVSINYPKSDSGGSVTETVEIPVDITIHVNTNQFDRNVDQCNDHLDALTMAVAGAEAAQIAAKKESARKIGSTLVDGFFSYVRYEITQQVSELDARVNSLLFEMAEMRKSCADLTAQMGSDFKGIFSRYTTLFGELDKDTRNRIVAIDAPAFRFASQMDELLGRTMRNRQLGTVAVSAQENASLQSMIFASSTKKRACDVIAHANDFILDNVRQRRTISDIQFPEQEPATVYAPVVITETSGPTGKDCRLFGLQNRILDVPQPLQSAVADRFENTDQQWNTINNTGALPLTAYLEQQIANMDSSSAQAERVRDTVRAMWTRNTQTTLINN